MVLDLDHAKLPSISKGDLAMIYGVKEQQVDTSSRACTRILHGSYEISIAMDDSCGALSVMSRSDLRVYVTVSGSGDSIDVTDKVFDMEEWGNTVYGTFDNLLRAMEWVRMRVEQDKVKFTYNN
jgi:hypothetical protein